MNKSYALFAAAVLLCACGGNSYKPTFAPAAKGTTTGTATSQMIDSTGGTVTSADGRIKITVPAGMFTSATAVGIQPITNTAPNGLGLAYRLTPEGAMFSQPVTLTFTLNDTEALALNSSFIVTQGADGIWTSQPGLHTRDSAAKTISVPAQHFSDWSINTTVELTPNSARVRTNDSTKFVPTVTLMKDVDLGEGTIEQIPQTQQLTDDIGVLRSWQVDPSGGKGGRVEDENNPVGGNYTAPTSVPDPAVATVTLTATFGSDTTKKITAAAKVDIYGQDTWQGSSHVTIADGTVIDSTFTFVQTSDNNGQVRLNVQSGTVHATVPATLPSGCTQTATPTDYAIGPNDGQMTAVYATSDDQSPMVSGMGTTVWLATYNTVCPNGPGSAQAAIQAQWWPFMLGGAPMPVMAVNGVLDTNISANGVTGNVHLVRE